MNEPMNDMHAELKAVYERGQVQFERSQSDADANAADYDGACVDQVALSDFMTLLMGGAVAAINQRNIDQLTKVMQFAMQHGMYLMRQHLLVARNDTVIAAEAVLREVSDRAEGN